MQANPFRECLESNSGLGAMQGKWASSKTSVEINNGIEMVYQCHCLVTGRRMRESMDAYTPPGQTTWTLGRGGERVGSRGDGRSRSN